MPKMKSKKALLKRIKVSKTGKVMRSCSFRSHLSANKSQKQLRQSRHGAFLHQTDCKRLKTLIR